jgi:hypothetical protein
VRKEALEWETKVEVVDGEGGVVGMYQGWSSVMGFVRLQGRLHNLSGGEFTVNRTRVKAGVWNP